MTDDIYDSLDKMIELCERKVVLMHEMKRALRVADLLGMPPKEMKEKVSIRVVDGPSWLSPWKGAVLHARYGEETREFPLEDVHMDLWPSHLRDQYKRSRARRARQGAPG